MSENRAVVVVGGYGEVGAVASRQLSMRGLNVTIAGRDGARAQAAAATIGCRHATIDLRDPNTWERAIHTPATVLCCVDQDDVAFVRWAVSRGCDYVDVTASDDFFRQVESLADVATAAGSTAVLSVGLTPGMTNLLAKMCAAKLEQCNNVQIAILLGLGDRHGDAAIHWTLDRLSRIPDSVSMARVRFPTRSSSHWAVPLDIADQHVIRRTLGIERVETVVTFESSFWTRTAVTLREALRHGSVRRIVARLGKRALLGSETWALAVEANGLKQGLQHCARTALTGKREVEATGLVAARVIELLPNYHRPGVHHIEQLLDVETLAEGHDALRPAEVTVTAS